jgi:hypothetical protein
MEGALTFCRTGDIGALEVIAHREIALCEEAGMPRVTRRRRRACGTKPGSSIAGSA